MYRERGTQWYRVIHGATVVEDRAAIATVQRILGDQYAELELELELEPVDPAA